MLKAALIGENIQRSRFADALEIMCKHDGGSLDFTLHDSALVNNFNFETHVAMLREEGYDGVTVTHPFKPQADALADIRNEYPATLGASNLLRFDGSKITAFNTDYTGFKAAWNAAFDDAKPGKVAMAGAGGVARALAQALMDLGAEQVSIWDQNDEAARVLATSLDPEKKVLKAVPAGMAMMTAAMAKGIVNATPMGMAEHPGSAIPEGGLGMQEWAFDAVYTPKDTRFLKLAKGAGVKTLSGFELFRHMAVRSYAHYTGQDVNPAHLALLDPLAEGI